MTKWLRVVCRWMMLSSSFGRIAREHWSRSAALPVSHRMKVVSWLLCNFHSSLLCVWMCANCDTKRVNIRKKQIPKSSSSKSIDAASTSPGQRKENEQPKKNIVCIQRHQNKLAKRINYVWLSSERSRGGKVSTHKIDNKQHEDCARQYLNAINNQCTSDEKISSNQQKTVN